MRFSSNPRGRIPHIPFQSHSTRRFLTSLLPKEFRNRSFQPPSPPASFNNSNHHHHHGSQSKVGSNYLVPGATVATLLMLSALHARRLYKDKRVEDACVKGIEVEFQPDLKVLGRSSKIVASANHIEILGIPCKHYLEEVALPLEEYASLRNFFVRRLKEGSRPIDSNPNCLVTGNSFLPAITEGKIQEVNLEEKNGIEEDRTESLSTVSSASAKVRDMSAPAGSLRGLFYCVIYLRPGDYHRIHAPADWNVHIRRHFPAFGLDLYPMNERAVRTIRNLYVENERVVLEGWWLAGMMAMAAVGATNIGSSELFIEPELHPNQPSSLLQRQEPPQERYYDPEGVGIALKRGEELGAFNMGSMVVLVFQAPMFSSLEEDNGSLSFRFCVEQRDRICRICVGHALGRWQDGES